MPNNTPLILPQKSFGMEARAHAHKMVMDVAVEMANVIWEQCAGLDSAWRRANSPRKRYIRQALPYLIPKARATLVDLMNATDDIATKDKIYEALCLDNQFVNRIVS